MKTCWYTRLKFSALVFVWIIFQPSISKKNKNLIIKLRWMKYRPSAGPLYLRRHDVYWTLYIFHFIFFFLKSSVHSRGNEVWVRREKKKKIKESIPTKRYLPWDPPPPDCPNNNNYISDRHEVCIYIIHYMVYRRYIVRMPSSVHALIFCFIQSSLAYNKILYNT